MQFIKITPASNLVNEFTYDLLLNIFKKKIKRFILTLTIKRRASWWGKNIPHDIQCVVSEIFMSGALILRFDFEKRERSHKN